MAYAGSSPWRISFRSRTDSVSAAMGAPERKGGEMAHRGEADAPAETHSDSGTAQGVVPDGAARIPFAAAEIAPDAREAAARVLASGWVTTGPEVQAFEREFAAWVGAGHALAGSSCTAAIELALRGLDLPPGAKVLTSVLTFCGAVHAITHAGHQPVFADVDRETLMPGAAELAAAAGLPLDRVVEDAAHALGTTVGDDAVGTIGAATCFSFYATKNLPIGEGGMITTADDGLAEWLRGARLHGISRDAWRRYLPGANWRYRVEADGLKANMTDVQAAIGRAQLPGITAPWRPRQGRHAWHLYVVRVGPEHGLGRDALITELARRGIDCSVHFIPLHHQPWFQRRWGEALAHGFPGADAVFGEIVSLPLYPSLADGDVDRVCEAIADLGGSGGLKSEAATQAAGGHAQPSGSPPVNRAPRLSGPNGDMRMR